MTDTPPRYVDPLLTGLLGLRLRHTFSSGVSDVRALFSGRLSDSASDQIFFSHITDLRFWRDAEKYSRSFAYLTFSLVDYGLVCATIEHVAMPSEFQRNHFVNYRQSSKFF